MKKDRRSFDPRRHWQQTQGRLIVIGLALLIVVGGGLVWALYGNVAAYSAVACLLVAVGLVGLLWLILVLLEKWVKEDEP
jgi:membrane protein YdbS with pleckstrin-like domain